MANFNKVFLMGNLTRDPALSYLPSQTAVCEIGLAINRKWTDQQGQAKEETTFVDCSAFGRTAETISKYLKKGRPVFVEGRLKLDQWEAQDGTKRSKMRVIIDNFQFIDSGGRATEGGGGDDGGMSASGGGYGGNSQPRPPQRQPMRAPNRPAPGPAAGPAQAPRQPAYEDDQSANLPPDDDVPAISNDDIPF
jgi:single-strand DNA-binding protein